MRRLTLLILVALALSCAQNSQYSVEALKQFEADGSYVIPVKDQTVTLRKLDGDFFLMGDTPDLGLINKPTIHGVILDGYAIGTAPVSQSLWAAVMGGESGKGPVHGISWEQAQKFIGKLSALTGIPFRMPTEAEWEYAARRDASMYGGLWEWCQDRWVETLGENLGINPTGPSEGEIRALRGGGKKASPKSRQGLDQHVKPAAAGLRLAVSTGELCPEYWRNLILENKVEREQSNLKTEVIKVGGVAFGMIPVKGGTFKMGATAPTNLKVAEDDEFPVHEVTLDNFKIGQYEVTADLWKAVMGKLPPQQREGRYPVCNVSWYDVQFFIRELNRLTGRKFRLPTEAEWEYAAKGGLYSQNSPFSGAESSLAVSWHEMDDKKTRPVGKLLPNEIGTYDMSGNAWEWVQDRPGPYSEDAQVNPTGPAEAHADIRVIRGGSVSAKWQGCRVSNRGENYASKFKSTIGFRLAL